MLVVGMLAPSSTPVSYTHLDVYKRQSSASHSQIRHTVDEEKAVDINASIVVQHDLRSPRARANAHLAGARPLAAASTTPTA